MNPSTPSLAATIRGSVPALAGAALAALDARVREKPARASGYLRIFQTTYNLTRTALINAAGVGAGSSAATFARVLPARLVVDGVWGPQSRYAVIGVLGVAAADSRIARGWVGRMPDAGARLSYYTSWLASMPSGVPIYACVTRATVALDAAPTDATAITALAQWTANVARGAQSACPSPQVPTPSVAPDAPQPPPPVPQASGGTITLPAEYVTALRTTPGAQWPWLVAGAGVLGLVGYFVWQKVRT